MMTLSVSDALLGDGLPIYLTSKYGTTKRCILQIDRKEANIEPKICWSNEAGRSCVELSFVNSITAPSVSVAPFQKILVNFAEFSLILEVHEQYSADVFAVLSEMHKKAIYIRNLERDYNLSKAQGANAYTHTSALKATLAKSELKQEAVRQLAAYLRYKEGYISLERHVTKFRSRCLAAALAHWIHTAKDDNDGKMVGDRQRWRLHAAANLEIDLQAWYHALFFKEVYRLRGHFWYKDAVLPSYRASYDLVDNALTALEEAALAHILCSPDTTYGDVAGQMFVVQSILPAQLFALFNKLATEGVYVTKYPRTGRPAKKLFRFSFVEGNIYLTWKGKFGNQGVGIAEITSILKGIQTDILKWSGSSSKADTYLSLICSDRSIDLQFESAKERDDWHVILEALIRKEHNDIYQAGVMDGVAVGVESDMDKLVLYSAIGKEL